MSAKTRKTHDNSVEQTTIVCSTAALHRAFKAAKTVAGNKTPYDVIQLRPDEDSNLTVCAVNDTTTFIARIEPEIFTISGKADEVIEFSKSVLPALIMATSGVSKNDVELLTGLHVAEHQVTITDETGIGLDIALVKVKRNHDCADIGDPRKTAKRVLDHLQATEEVSPVRPLPHQMTAIARVAQCMGGRPGLYQRVYMHKDVSALRCVAVCPSWMMSVLDRPGLKDTDLEETGEKTPVALRVVQSRPPQGIS